jgi:hypothetical protein
MAAAVKQEKQQPDAKPFYVPGSEEEALVETGGGKGKRPRAEGSSGLSATGLTPSQELLSQTTRRDRDVLARLQRVMQQQQREGAEGKKKKRARGEEEEAAAAAAAKQQCRMCYQTAAVYVSPCNHLACLSCWKGWLGRQPEGMGKCFYKCRHVTLQQLKRVVHDQPQGGKAKKGDKPPPQQQPPPPPQQQQQQEKAAASSSSSSSSSASAAAPAAATESCKK